MPLETIFFGFLPALIAVVVGSVWLSRALTTLSGRIPIQPGLMGLITALGADSPEITSAVTALVAGEHEVGLGVVLGSNLFNLAGLLGLSGILAGRIALPRASLVFNGVVSLVATTVVALLIYRAISPAWALGLLVLILAGYTLLLSFPEGRVRSALPAWLASPLARLLGAVHEHAARKASASPSGKSVSGWWLGFQVVAALLLIVQGSMGIVHTTLPIAEAAGIPRSLVGALILAALTGIPNAYTAAQLARRKEGAAVVSETLNSNTINLVVGIGLPVLIFGMHAEGGVAILEIWWLLGLTGLAVLLPALAGAINRRIGLAIIGLYLVFAAVRVALQ